MYLFNIFLRNRNFGLQPTVSRLELTPFVLLRLAYAEPLDIHGKAEQEHNAELP